MFFNSIILVSPQNEILLLQRVKTSTSYASAHVFPGGHLSIQDGELPPVDDVRRHEDNQIYRMSAIRECFEESGILLAKSNHRPEYLLMLNDEEREHGRHIIHQNQIDFQTWVEQHGGTPDLGALCYLALLAVADNLITLDNLIPFTRWLTPVHVARRFSTQMYLYFLPIFPPSLTSSTNLKSFPSLSRSTTVHSPTSDGGIEHTAARFRPPSEWLSLYDKNEIVLFPPQFFLLHLISRFLSPSPSKPPLQPSSAAQSSPSLLTANDIDTHTLNQQREALIAFTKTSTPPWTEKCISPLQVSRNEQRSVMGLHDPGPELQGTGRGGEEERVLVAVPQAGTRHRLEVRWRWDVLGERNKGLERL